MKSELAAQGKNLQRWQSTLAMVEAPVAWQRKEQQTGRREMTRVEEIKAVKSQRREPAGPKPPEEIQRATKISQADLARVGHPSVSTESWLLPGVEGTGPQSQCKL